MNKVRLGDVCTKGSSNIKQSDLVNNNGDYPIYGAGGFIKNVDFFTQDKPYIGIVKDGAGVGRVMKLPAFSSVIGTMQYIIPNEDIDVSYLAYAMEHMNLSKYYMGAAIPHIYFKDYKNEKLPNYTKDEQAQIVHKLDLVCDLITKRNNQLSKLDELIKSRFVEMFGEVESLISKWQVMSFREVTINYNHTRKPVKESDRKKIQGIYPYYGATGIVDYVNDYKIDGTFLLVSEDGKALEFRNKNIAFIAKGKIWVNNHAHVLKCSSFINMIFLLYYMNYRDIKAWITGIDQKKLNRDNLDNIPVGVPPIDLQNKFADFVTQIEKQKATVQQSIDKLETLKKSLMQEYFE